jgi:nucleoside-diphosphate-sugar epimerase
MLAKAFRAFEGSDEILIFASGTADSLETRPSEFLREEELLARTRDRCPDSLLVYMSSCSLADPDRGETPYVQHKRRMEQLLERDGRPYLILRLPVVIGNSNLAKTLPFFIRDQILGRRELAVWTGAVRYPIDIDDAVRIAAAVIADPALRNRRVDIALRPYGVPSIVRAMERVLGRSTVKRDIARGSAYALDLEVARRVAGALGIAPDEGYLGRVLAKYFAPEASSAAAAEGQGLAAR